MKHFYGLFLTLFMYLTTLVYPVNAQWIQTDGPCGGPVYGIIGSGFNILAGGDYGLYLSTDNGATWNQQVSKITLIRVNTFASIGSYLFAGTWGNGVIVSTDNGVTWASTALSNQIVRSFAVSGTTLYAGTLYTGVWRTTDYGAT